MSTERPNQDRPATAVASVRPVRPPRAAFTINATITLVLMGILVSCLNYLAARHYRVFDLSQSGFYTLSERTESVVKGLKQPVTLYSMLSFKSSMEKLHRQVELLMKRYQDINPDKVQYWSVDLFKDRELATRLAEEFQLKDGDDILLVEMGDQKRVIDFDEIVEDQVSRDAGVPRRVQSIWAEEKITSAILSLVEGRTPKVYFITGFGEADMESTDPLMGFSELGTRLNRENMRVAQWNLAVDPDIPADADGVVILGPEAPYHTNAMAALQEYVGARKGRIVMALDPGTTTGLEAFAAEFGVDVGQGLVVDTLAVMGSPTVTAQFVPGVRYAAHPIVSRFGRVSDQSAVQVVFFAGTRPVAAQLDANGQPERGVTELVWSQREAWAETEPAKQPREYDDGRDVPGPLPLAAAVDTGIVSGGGVDLSGARMVVFGSSTTFANGHALKAPTAVDLFLNGLNWALRRDARLDIQPKVPREFTLGLASAQIQTMMLIVGGLLPMCALMVGGAVWLRRRV